MEFWVLSRFCLIFYLWSNWKIQLSAQPQFFFKNGLKRGNFTCRGKIWQAQSKSYMHLCSGVTRGGWVAHPWKVWGKFWKGEMMKKGRKREKGKGEGNRGGKGKERQGKKGKMKREKRREGKIVEENLQWKGKGMKMSRELFFFFLLVIFCTKMEILGGNFLTLPTFDCTPGYAPAFVYVKSLFQTLFSTWSIVI